MPHIANKTENKFIKLALKYNITIKKGWKTALAPLIGVSLNQISTWIKRDNISKKGKEIIESAGNPLEEWYTEPEPYPITEQHMVGRTAGDSDSDEAGRSDIEKDIQNVRKIYESGHTAIIGALRANIEQFHEMIKEKEEREREKIDYITQIQALESHIKDLEKEVKRARNFNDGSPEIGDDAEDA